MRIPLMPSTIFRIGDIAASLDGSTDGPLNAERPFRVRKRMSVVGYGLVTESEVAFIGALIELILEQHWHLLLSNLPVMCQRSFHCLAYTVP